MFGVFLFYLICLGYEFYVVDYDFVFFVNFLKIVFIFKEKVIYIYL